MVVDRIEGDYAVVENEGIMLDIPLSQLPCDIKEGDVLRHCDGVYIIDNEAAAAAREKISARLGNLFKKE